MKILRSVVVLGAFLILLLGLAFAFQMPFATSLWPWPDGRLSYLFIGSVFAAISASVLWIGWTGEFGALAGGSLNIFVIALTSFFYLLHLGLQEQRANMIPLAIIALLVAAVSIAVYLRSRRLPLADSRPTPLFVKISFGVFMAALILASIGLIARAQVFPWPLNPDSSVIFGCIFLGNATYFLYGLLRPIWHNALGQLLSFLAYDLVLIGPEVLLFKTVKPEYFISLVIYVMVLIFSGAIAIYFLFINRQTRLGA